MSNHFNNPNSTNNPDDPTDNSNNSTNNSNNSTNNSNSSTNDSNNSNNNDDETSNGHEDVEGRSGETYTQSWQEIAETTAKAQRCNIRHNAAEVAKAMIPFETEDEMHAFALALDNALASDGYPAGFRLNEEYESLESYKTGHSSKPLVIPLPYIVWFPCIVVWCKALDLLKHLPICKAAVGSL